MDDGAKPRPCRRLAPGLPWVLHVKGQGGSSERGTSAATGAAMGLLWTQQAQGGPGAVGQGSSADPGSPAEWGAGDCLLGVPRGRRRK